MNLATHGCHTVSSSSGLQIPAKMINGIHKDEIVLFLYSTPDTASAGIQDKVNSQRNTDEHYQGKEPPGCEGGGLGLAAICSEQ